MHIILWHQGRAGRAELYRWKQLPGTCRILAHWHVPHLGEASFNLLTYSWLIDWLMLGSEPHSPDAPRPYEQALCAPYQNQGSPVALPKPQMAPKLILLTSSGSKKKDPRYLYLSEAKASHSHRMWAKVSSLAPHFLHSGLSSSPNKWRCLRRVLCLVRRPVTTLDWFLLKDRSLILVPGQGPEINSRACLGVLPRSHQLAQFWLISQRLSLFLISHLETPKAGLGPSNLRAIPCEPYWHTVVMKSTKHRLVLWKLLCNIN
jgi:hypothetical protein